MGSYTVTLEIEGKEPLELRRPTPYIAIDLIQWWKRTIQAADSQAVNETDTDTILESVKHREALINAAWGRVIGRVLTNPPDVTGDSPEEYGLGVWLALHDQGWSVPELEALGEACIEVLKHEMQAPTREAVKYRLDFGAARRDLPTSH